MVRLVLFDIDGTLIRTGGAGVRAFAQAADLVFQRPRGTAHLDFAGRTDSSIVREFLHYHGFEQTHHNIERFLESYVFLLDAQMEAFRGDPCPGVDDFIDELASFDEPPVLGLLTGNIRLGAEIKLRHHQMWEWFEMGAFGDDHEDRNQLAQIAKLRAEHFLGVPVEADEVLVIGDTPRDVECAAAIGAKCLAVATGKSSVTELQACGAAWAVETLSGISVREVCA